MTGQAPRIDGIDNKLADIDSGTYIPVASNFVNVQGSSGNRTHHWIKIKTKYLYMDIIRSIHQVL